MAAPKDTGDRGLDARDRGLVWASDRLLLQSVNPYWAHASWKVDPRSVRARRERAGDPSARLVLRFHAAPPSGSDPAEGSARFEVEVAGEEGTYYANFWRAGHRIEAELGVLASSGRFVPIVRSNAIELPPDGESPRYEVRWQRVLGAPSALWRPRFAEEVEQLAAAEEAVGGLDSELARELAPPPPLPSGPWEPVLHAACEVSPPPEVRAVEPLPEAPPGPRAESPAPALPRAASAAVSSFEKPTPGDRPYLEVRADIVIYGVARPGSEVVIEGVKVPVRTDGTFDVRFGLPPSRPSPEAAAPKEDAGEGGAP